MNKEVRTDISVVGAGVTGLMLTNKLTDLGYNVALIDNKPTVASGPSTKNEGWLHNGTYHATSISNEQQSSQVAKRCMYGHNEIRKFAPEAIEDGDRPSYAVVSDDEYASHAVVRWENAKVPYKEVPLDKFRRANPEVDTDSVAHTFEVDDVSINTRILYQKLLVQSRRNGAHIFLNSNLFPHEHKRAELAHADGSRTQLRSELFVVTAGYGIKDLYDEVTGDDLPVRYWKSHLLVFPRITENNIFSLNPGEAALFNHTTTSVVGQHEDAVAIDEPNFDTLPDNARHVFDATRRLIPTAGYFEDVHKAIACIKPDIALATGQARSLDMTVFEPSEDYLFALPGKMTEAPYVTDKLTQLIFARDIAATSSVALRPCDIYNKSLVNHTALEVA